MGKPPIHVYSNSVIFQFLPTSPHHRPLRPRRIFSLHSLQYHFTMSKLEFNDTHIHLQGNRIQHTILSRRFRHPDTREMEPLSRTSIIIACHHLTKADLIAVAVPRLLFLVLVVDLVERFFVGRDCRLNGGLLGGPLRCGVVASRGPRA